MKKKTTLLVGGAALIAVVGIGTVATFRSVEPPRALERAQEHLESLQETYESDTYGGTTPEETLTLFTEALNDGDLSRASRLFLPEDQREQRSKLEDIKKQGLLDELIRRLAMPRTNYPLVDGENDEYVFETLNESGELLLQVYLTRIPNGTWKIVDF